MAGVSTKLKGYATNPTLQFRDLFEKSVVAENVFNAIINTNVEVIKNSEQRRIVIFTINTSRVKGYNYFQNIKNKCYNLEVGEAFYSYLASINVDNFVAQRIFSLTENKRNAISQLLPTPFKFLKEKLLKKSEIGRIKPKELYCEYKNFCEFENAKLLDATKFYEKLTEILRLSVNKQVD